MDMVTYACDPSTFEVEAEGMGGGLKVSPCYMEDSKPACPVTKQNKKVFVHKVLPRKPPLNLTIPYQRAPGGLRFSLYKFYFHHVCLT